MTLILTTLCKDGVCICADKRYIIGGTNKIPKIEDNHQKIYKFKDISLAIFNHGVNKFNGKPWERFCINYEKLNRWQNIDLIQIAEDFKNFIENEVKSELVKNINDGKVSGFVVCGKTKNDNKYKIKELCWEHKSGDVIFKPVRHKHNLIGSGIGYEKYLDSLIRNDNKLNQDNFWKRLDFDKAMSELKKLFSKAIEERNRLKGDEFSDSFDIECVS